MNEDVRLGVERGYFRSGLEHYELHGKREGRKIVRFDPNSHSIQDYTRLVRTLIDGHPDNLDLAMAKAVGSTTLESFRDFGDRQYHVLVPLWFAKRASHLRSRPAVPVAPPPPCCDIAGMANIEERTSSLIWSTMPARVIPGSAFLFTPIIRFTPMTIART